MPNRSRSVLSRRLLQGAVAVLALVPVSAGLLGAGEGATAFGARLDASGDDHFRYLSGLLLAIGLAFWCTVPRIERHAGRFRLLTALVVCGGLFRLLGVVRARVLPPDTGLALLMELVVTPALCWWQSRIAAAAAAR